MKLRSPSIATVYIYKKDQAQLEHQTKLPITTKQYPESGTKYFRQSPRAIPLSNQGFMSIDLTVKTRSSNRHSYSEMRHARLYTV